MTNPEVQFIDDLTVREIFVDKLVFVGFDQTVCKVVFSVQRSTNGGPKIINKVACRLVMTPEATVETARELTKLAAMAMQGKPKAV